MVYENNTPTIEQMLLSFMAEQDPMQSMLQWLCEQLMEAELKSKIKADRSERTDDRIAYRSGYRADVLIHGWAPCIYWYQSFEKVDMCRSLCLKNQGQKQRCWV